MSSYRSRYSAVFIVTFEQVSHIFQHTVFLLLTFEHAVHPSI